MSGSAPGIYSNTWQRQDNGDRELAASVMTFEPAESAHASSEEAFPVTRYCRNLLARETGYAREIARFFDGGKYGRGACVTTFSVAAR